MQKFHFARILLEAGASTQLQNSKGNTPIHLAEYKTAILEDVVKYSKDLNPQNIALQTPMHVAAYKGHKSCVKALKEAGARDDIMDKAGKTVSEILPSI